MARFLYVWELGDNYGHMSSFATIAKALVQAGHEVFVALQNLSEAGKFFDGTGVHYLQAPLWRGKAWPGKTIPVTYADVIRPYGFRDSAGLATLIRAWRELYTLVNPDMVIFNSPPVALLASRGMDFKKVTLGSGYCLPPKTTPLPTLRPWEKIPPVIIEEREARVVHSANRALAALGLPVLRALRDIFTTDDDFLCTFKEFDHYPQRERAEYYGTTFTMDKGPMPKWPEGNGQKVFAYLRPGTRFFQPFLEGMKEVDARFLVVAPGISASVAEQLTALHITISPEPVNMAAAREECDAVICHAGHGTVAAFLLAGKPLIVCPNYLEQVMMANHLLRTGAVMVADRNENMNPAAMMKELLSSATLKDAAQKLAYRYRSFSQEQQTARIIGRMEALLG